MTYVLGLSTYVQDPPTVDTEALAVLATWPTTAELKDVDLSLSDRNRVSALPWRGQFSPLTVERLLDALSPRDATVLDPFVGSGTTMLEAARRGQASIGLDINPAAIAFATCAGLAGYEADERAAFIRQANEVAPEALQVPTGSQEWEISISHALALLAKSTRGGTAATAANRLQALVEALPAIAVPTRAILGDARDTKLEDDAAGFVVTSPPYINVFNYHQHGRPLTDAFGWPVLAAARSEIGSNRQNRQNRFRTVVQYSIDMALVLNELTRVLIDGSTFVFVMGRESRVRGIPFYNGDLMARLVEALGVSTDCSRAERRFTNRFGQAIYEDVLVMKASRACAVPRAQVEAIGRAIGVDALCRCTPTDETARDIDSVLASPDSIGPSPLKV